MRQAFVDLLFAIVAAKARLTFARIRTVRVEAFATIQARITDHTFVNIYLTQCSRVTGSRAITFEATDFVDTFTVVQTRLRFTIVEIHFAPQTGEARARQTFAFYAISIWWHFTGAVVQTRIILAERMRNNFRFTQ